ncbi:MAG: hypothetical protein QOE40_1065, partial [Actinomycetota bacterium]|nr:hypothetical protein [Actinomycetota bacterium]
MSQPEEKHTKTLSSFGPNEWLVDEM